MRSRRPFARTDGDGVVAAGMPPEPLPSIPSMIQITCPSELDTRAAAARLAALCRAGDVVLLDGAMGAGKTAFVGGMADGLGVEEPVASPTFVLMRRYDSGFLPLIHVDVYRMTSMGEFEDLGAVESGLDGVVVIEWGSMVGAVVPADRLLIEIDVDDAGVRSLRLRPFGQWASRPLGEIVG